MIDGVVFIVKELLAALENVDCIGFQVDIQTELAVIADAGFRSKDFVNGVNQIDRSTQALAGRIRKLRV